MGGGEEEIKRGRRKEVGEEEKEIKKKERGRSEDEWIN